MPKAMARRLLGFTELYIAPDQINIQLWIIMFRGSQLLPKRQMTHSSIRRFIFFLYLFFHTPRHRPLLAGFFLPHSQPHLNDPSKPSLWIAVNVDHLARHNRYNRERIANSNLYSTRLNLLAYTRCNLSA